MNTTLKLAATVVALAASVATGNASAARPASLGGTTWTVQTDRDSVQLVITSQGGAGATGAANCRTINGDLGNVVNVRGWYCLSTGRIHFVHRNLDSGNAARVFTGNVSDDMIGQPLYMAGTMTVLDAAHGDLGEYNFSAVKQ